MSEMQNLGTIMCWLLIISSIENFSDRDSKIKKIFFAIAAIVVIAVALRDIL